MSSEEERIEEIFERYRKLLAGVERSKQNYVRQMALELENLGIAPEFVGELVTRGLEGYVSQRYIQECLDKKYKRKYQKSAVQHKTENAEVLYNVEPVETSVTEEQKKPIIIDTEGRPQENEISDEEDHRSEPQIRDQVEASMMRTAPTLEAELNALRKEVEELKEMIRTLETERDEFKEIAAKKNLVEATQLMPKPGEIRMKARDFNDVVQIAALSRQEIRIEHDGLRAVKLVRITGGERR